MFIEKHSNNLYTAKAAQSAESTNDSLISTASANISAVDARRISLSSNVSSVSATYNTVNTNYNSVLNSYNSVDTLTKCSVLSVENNDLSFSVISTSAELNNPFQITGASLQITKKAGTKVVLKSSVIYRVTGSTDYGYLSGLTYSINGTWYYPFNYAFDYVKSNQSQTVGLYADLLPTYSSGNYTIRLGLVNYYSGFTVRVDAFSLLLLEIPSV